MKALTIRQPWAWAITHGSKRVENRTWRASHRGLLAIHAAARIDQGALDDMRVRAAVRTYGREPDYVTGAVIAVATLTGVHTSCQPECSLWAAHGQHHWELADVRPLTAPVPCKGRLGLWDLPTDVQTAVEGPLAAADWNATHEVGTPVLAWPGRHDADPLTTATRTPAWTLGCGDAVVSVEGAAGGIYLTHVEPIPAAVRPQGEETPEAAGEEYGTDGASGGCDAPVAGVPGSRAHD